MLIALMLASLLMSVAIPEAFGDRGLLFACSYVAIQVGRMSFLAFAAAEPGTVERARSVRILIWFIASGVLWVAGGLAEDSARTALWLGALALDYGAPLVIFWIPGKPRMDPSAWEITSAHFAERFQLFVIIALGESIVITGATTSDLNLDTATIAALGLAFLGTASLWWIYFDFVAGVLQRTLERGEDRILLARDLYTYMHALIIAAIIVSAVGDELVIAHPTEELPDAELVAVAAGPTLYLLAQLALRLRATGQIGWARLTAVTACLAVGLLARSASALVVAGLLVAVLIGVIVTDQLAASRRRARDESYAIDLEGRPG